MSQPSDPATPSTASDADDAPYASYLGAAFGAAALDFLGHGAEDPDAVVETFLRDIPAPLFSGRPEFRSGEAVLVDADEIHGGEANSYSRLVVSFPEGYPGNPDPGLTLLLYVDDLTAPRERIPLAEVLRDGGERALNVGTAPGQRVRLVLRDPAGAWCETAPEIEVRLE